MHQKPLASGPIPCTSDDLDLIRERLGISRAGRKGKDNRKKTERVRGFRGKGRGKEGLCSTDL